MRDRNWFAFLFFLLLAVLFFWPLFFKGQVPFPGDLLVAEYAPWSSYSYLGYVPGSFPHKAQYFDTLRQIYPWKILSLDIFKDGQWPLWNPYNFSGTPLLANSQSAVFYLLNIFYLFLPPLTAWTLLVALQPLLAGFFTYLFGRQIGLKKAGALFAGLAFAYSGFMAVFLEYNIIGQTVLWLPLAGYFFEKLLKKRQFWWFLGLALTLAVLFLAGHLPSAGLVFVFLLVYFFFRIWSQKKKAGFGLKIIILMVLSLGVAAIQLLPTFELISLAARVSHDYQELIQKLLIQPKQLLMLLMPDLFGNPATRNYLLNDTYVGKVTYIGLVPLAFSVFALCFFRKKKLIRFFALAAIAVFGLITSWPLTRFIYQFKIPLLLTSSPTNAIFLASFSLAILAGFGFDQWFDEKRKRKRLVLGVPALVLLLIWFFSGISFLEVSQRNLLYSSFVFLAWVVVIWGFPKIFKKSKILILNSKFLILSAALSLTILDLFYFFHKFNPFVPRVLVYPQAEVLSWLEQNAGFDRFWGYGSAKIDANFSSQYQLFSPDGYDPLYPRRYGEFIYSSREGLILEDFDSRTRSDADVVPGFGEDDLPNNPYREKILDLLGVRFILDKVGNHSTEKTFPQGRYRPVWQDQGWFVFENLMAAPRVFLAGDYLVFKDNQDFEEKFFNPDFEIQRTILLEEEPELKPGLAGLARAKIITYGPNQVFLETDADAHQLLFLSDNYYPGWQAFIDGQQTKIYRANYTFRAIAVPKGKHQVLFRYQPQSFSWGAKISIISLMLVLVFSFWLNER